jgi:hypothetical protein
MFMVKILPAICTADSKRIFTKKRLLASILLPGFCVAMCPTFPVMAQSLGALECKAALVRARQRIKAKIVKSNMARHSYSNFPTGRSQNYFIVLSNSDPASEQLMSTPNLMSSIASNITSACKDVGYVNFSIDQTDNAASFGLVGGRVAQFKCADFNGNMYVDANGKKYAKLPWGYEGCP